MAINELPAVPATALPAAVRNGSDDDKQAYKAALGFEQILLGQLVDEMLPKGDAASVIEVAITKHVEILLERYCVLETDAGFTGVHRCKK